MDEKNNPDDEKKRNYDKDKKNEEINEKYNESLDVYILNSYNNETHIIEKEENDNKHENIIKYNNNRRNLPLEQNNYYIDKTIKPNNKCNDIIINNVDVSEFFYKNETSNVNLNELCFSTNTKKNDNINNNDCCYNYTTGNNYSSSLDTNNKNYCKQNCNILNISKDNINEKYDINKNQYISLVKQEKQENKNNYVNTQNDCEFLYNMDNIKLTGTSVMLTNETSKYIYKLIPFFKNGEAQFYVRVNEAYNDIYKKGEIKTPLGDVEMDDNKNENNDDNNLNNDDNNLNNDDNNLNNDDNNLNNDDNNKNKNNDDNNKNKNNDDNNKNKNNDDNNNNKNNHNNHNKYSNCNYSNLYEYTDILFRMDNIYNLFLETQKKCIEDNSGKDIFFSILNKKTNISIVHNKVNNPSNVDLDVCNTYEHVKELTFEENYYHTILCEPVKKLYISEKRHINIHNILNGNNYIYDIKTNDCKNCNEFSLCNDKTMTTVKRCQCRIYEKFILSLLVKYKLIPQCFDLVKVIKCTQNEKHKKNVKEDENFKMCTNIQPTNEITNNTNYQHEKEFIKFEKNSPTENYTYEDIHSLNRNYNHKNKCIVNNDQEIWKVHNDKCKNNHDVYIHSSLKLEKVCYNIKAYNQQIIDLKLGYNTIIDNDLSFNKDLLKDSHSVDSKLKEYYVDKWSKMKKEIRKKFTTTNVSDQHIIDLCSKDLNLPTCFDKYNNKDIYALLKSWRQNVTALKSTQRNLGFRICTLIQHINYSDLLNDDQVKIQYSNFVQDNYLLGKNNIGNTETNTLKKYSELNKIEIKDCYDHVTKKLKINRHLGLTLREDQVIYVLSIFFKKIVHLILPQLLNLKIWLEQQYLYSFCSTSLLIIYDKNKPSFCDIKWIDFTYSLQHEANLKHYPLNNTKLNMDIVSGLNNLIKLCRTIFFTNIIPPIVKNDTKRKKEE
ncbi:kinase, putative [Plasmodium reichenowi]|uniref:Kinase n=1 Tax=Plasmodium reichenowi TaxID=5854 RepID=A0A2P9D6Z1_PLARE|nr:kinase, putative [Plasmodium reichenowi]